MGALIPLAISIAPEIARWLFGSDGERVAQTATQVVASVTGAADPAAQQAALERDPGMATQLRVELARVAAEAAEAARKADLDSFSAALADTASARSQTIQLAQAGSPIAFGAPIVSVIVLTTFGIVMALALTRTIPSGSEALLNVLLGSLAAMATSVVSYWVGSSAGSARKEERIARLISLQAEKQT